MEAGMHIGTFEAKTHFSEIMEEGISRAEAIDRLKKCRELFKGDEKYSIRDAINEGRP
jgi:hypothetical protein